MEVGHGGGTEEVEGVDWESEDIDKEELRGLPEERALLMYSCKHR